MTATIQPRRSGLAYTALGFAIAAVLAIPAAYIVSLHPLVFIVTWLVGLITSIASRVAGAEPRWARRTALIISLSTLALVGGFILLLVIGLQVLAGR